MSESTKQYRVLFVSDLHHGSVFGLLPEGFKTSDDRIVGQNPGQAYLWRCWKDLCMLTRQLAPDILVVNGEGIDGCQRAQRGTELCLPLIEDQTRAAEESLSMLLSACPVRPAIYMTQGCLMPGHRVLTADLRWVPVEKLSVGDSLLSIAESDSRWEMAAVTAHLPVRKECVEVALETGEKLRCTEDHPFLAYNGTVRVWTPAGKLRRSSRLARLLPVWNTLTTREAGYVAGFFDGEGSLDYGPGHGCLRVSAAQRPNVMLHTVLAELERLGYAVSQSVGQYRNTDCINLTLLGGQQQTLRFLGSLRPPRLLSKFRGPSKLGRQRAVESVRVSSVTPLGSQQVVGMSTTAHTYISDGFGSHNTEYHEGKAGREMEVLAKNIGAEQYYGLGTGRFSREVLDLEINGVIINAAHHISPTAGFYRATASDREGQWSALAGKEGKSPKADVCVRSHVHYFVHVEHASKHIVVTPCWQLQTRFMRKNSVYRMLPDIGAMWLEVYPAAKARREDPIVVRKRLYDLPPFVTTKAKLPEDKNEQSGETATAV